MTPQGFENEGNMFIPFTQVNQRKKLDESLKFCFISKAMNAAKRKRKFANTKKYHAHPLKNAYM